MVIVGTTVLYAGQNAPLTPTFRAEVEYVEVDAIVTDGQGRLVRDLKVEDFQVFEDGKPQKIAAFNFINMPIERVTQPTFAGQRIEADVKTNMRTVDGRVYVMVIDDLHTNVTRTPLVKKAARQFIENNLGPNDIMAVVHTFGPADASQEFTNSRRLLLAAVDRTLGQKVLSETLGRNDEYARTKNLFTSGDPNGGTSGMPPVFDPNDMERVFQTRSTLEFLRKVSDWLAGVHGRRKSILFVSEGIDYNITDIMGTGFVPNNFVSNAHSGSTMIIDMLRDVITSATRANVSLYAIDPRGMTSLADDDITVGGFADADSGDPKIGIGHRSMMQELFLSQESLRALSDETGGFAVVNRNQFADAFARIVEDNSSYYELAYYPATNRRDGKYHKIQVRVTRPGLTVRARRGWMAPKGKPPALTKGADPVTVTLREAVNNPLPVSGLRLQMFGAPFKGTATNASVLVGSEMLGRDMKLAPGNKLKLMYVAVDAHDKVFSQTATVTMNFKPDTQAVVEERGLRVLGRLDLPPGRYQIRYAAHESGADTVGSVRYDLEVPDFAKAPLSLSGLVVTSALGSAIPTVRLDERLRALPGPPMAARTFPPNDELVLFVEIYDNLPAKPHTLELLTTLTGEDSTVRFRADAVLQPADPNGGPAASGYMRRIPLKEVPPGSYLIKVAVRARPGSETADRQMLIAVTSGPSPPSQSR